MKTTFGPTLTRRGFLTILTAGACACRREPVSPPGVHHWSGIGFGIEMSLQIFGVTEATGRQLAADCEQLIHELEDSFSLYQDGSELSVLNRERHLTQPSDRFRKLIEISRECSNRTLGYYQPAIHGAWQWLIGQDPALDVSKHPQWLEHCEAASLKHVSQEADGPIRLTHPLTRLSMNAIVQGHLADLVASRLRTAGVRSAMLHLGESLAIGNHPEGRPWKLAVMGTPANGDIDLVGNIEFSDAGLAVSAHDNSRRLVDPVAAIPCNLNRVAAVVSPEGAAVADAFATAFAVAPGRKREAITASLNHQPDSQVHIWQQNVRAFQFPGPLSCFLTTPRSRRHPAN